MRPHVQPQTHAHKRFILLTTISSTLFAMRDVMGGYAKFLPRLVKFRHLEFDSALQQAFWTVTNPKRLFRYHQDQNAMRGYWARDDPAFLLILLTIMAVSVIGYGLWLRLHVLGFFLALLWTVLSDCLLAGAIIATMFWLISNKLWRLKSSGPVKPVEWAYCFDVHLNAFFPLALYIYAIQMLCWPLLATHSILSIMASNFIWLLAATYYIYVTFLGYTVLPAMHNTMPLLYSVLPLMLLFVVSIPLKWNVARGFRAFYLWRAAAAH